jgi:hypothetical protein
MSFPVSGFILPMMPLSRQGDPFSFRYGLSLLKTAWYQPERLMVTPLSGMPTWILEQSGIVDTYKKKCHISTKKERTQV